MGSFINSEYTHKNIWPSTSFFLAPASLSKYTRPPHLFRASVSLVCVNYSDTESLQRAAYFCHGRRRPTATLLLPMTMMMLTTTNNAGLSSRVKRKGRRRRRLGDHTWARGGWMGWVPPTWNIWIFTQGLNFWASPHLLKYCPFWTK